MFDARIAAPWSSYRAFTYPWTGTPARSPALALRSASASAEALTAYASWNGATGVSAWQLLAGPSPTQLAAVATAPSSGFETAIAAHSSQPYFAVAALNAAGQTLSTSAVAHRQHRLERGTERGGAAAALSRLGKRGSGAAVAVGLVGAALGSWRACVDR